MNSLLGKINKLNKGVKTLSVWDIDDTLFESKNTHIYVISNNKIVKKLTTSEFNSHNLRPGEVYDFSEFRDAKIFFHGAMPLVGNVTQAKNTLESRNAFLLALTARADFNNKNLFLKKFKMYGLDMSTPMSHVARSGNLGMATAAGKKAVLEQCLNTGRFQEVHMFDDDSKNLDAFMSLKTTFKDITFKPFIVKKGKISYYG